MALTVLGSISVLFIISLYATRRKMHLFVRIIMWCFIISIQNNNIWLLSLNYKLFNLPQTNLNYFAFDCIRSIIVPFSIILFLECISVINSVGKKVFYGIITVLILVVVEYGAEQLGALHHSEKWLLWFSFANWSSIVFLSSVVHKLVRGVATRDVIT